MKKILGNPIIVFFFLIVFAPIGILLMCTCTDWSRSMKAALAIIFGVGFMVSFGLTASGFDVM
ncbi:MAG: hypothetical protein IKU84_03525 [Clostridia bacterium]|nr:hypothetical protein [Clostridia bacterium]